MLPTVTEAVPGMVPTPRSTSTASVVALLVTRITSRVSRLMMWKPTWIRDLSSSEIGIWVAVAVNAPAACT